MLEAGRNCWRIERADRAAVVVDAADYFRLAREAMLAARSQIILVGWDFDTRIELVHDAKDGAPMQLGPFLTWLPKRTPGLEIYILKWDIGALKLLERGTTVLRIARWAASGDIHFKLDGALPTGASHHQKILVLDDRVAFCGGIDMTAERWDTREHRSNDERRRRPTTHRQYGPWHDATMGVEGDAARALGELARERWAAAGGKPIAPPSKVDSNPWPTGLPAQFRNVDVAISRTRAAYRDRPALREIEALFLEQIASARRLVYAENQYFASRTVANALIERLADPDCPEFIIVNPRTGRGWLDEEAMSPARARVLEKIKRADVADRVRIYTPISEGGDDIYVHSKILIVDERLIRVGSANFNNRSMGLDSECDLTIDVALEANRDCGPAISDLLYNLLEEHLGVAAHVIRGHAVRTGSLIAAIDRVAGPGRRLKPLEPDKPNSIEKALADSEALDPESGGDEFEPMARPGLFAGMGSATARFRRFRRT